MKQQNPCDGSEILYGFKPTPKMTWKFANIIFPKNYLESIKYDMYIYIKVILHGWIYILICKSHNKNFANKLRMILVGSFTIITWGYKMWF